jgi:hypothetical protein
MTTSAQARIYTSLTDALVKGRLRPMPGFQTHASVARFGPATDAVRDVLRPAPRRKEPVPAARRPAIPVQSVAAQRDRLAVA